MGKLDRLANASAGGREDNVFKVLAYLNTRKYDFNPADIQTRVSVKSKTILSYLWAIARAQTCDQVFLDRINAGEAVQWYLLDKRFSAKEQEVAAKVYDRLKGIVQEPPQQKGQFTFDQGEDYRAVFYYRLELSLLFYELMA